jgi:hypothetical protein
MPTCLLNNYYRDEKNIRDDRMKQLGQANGSYRRSSLRFRLSRLLRSNREGAVCGDQHTKAQDL